MSRLDDVDLSQKLSHHDGSERLMHAQRRLTALRLQAGGQIGNGQLGPPLAVLFEGWDAAGKGGAIRRLTAPLDPRHYTVAQFAAPNERERRHHFLWRFGPSLPGWGGMSVFDRTWYGRVLVERVEKFATKDEWERAYEEIESFERGLAAEGMVLVKFWLHISEEEQLRRFQERESNPLKQWKLTDEDWRNRKRRDSYLSAIEDMLEHTDRPHAPWHLVAAESKPFARVSVLETVIAALENGLRAAGQEPVTIETDL
jgi:polyphosphate kinase 2 (PPK2 family)